MHSSGSLDDCNVFVKYLPHDLSDRDFYKMFKVYGSIVSSKIMLDQASGKSLGYGFVRYASASDSHKAIAAMNGHRIQNKRLLCKLANQSPSPSFNPEFIKNPLLVSQTPSDNLYVKPLLPTTSEQDLREIFSKFGVILDCKVMMDRYTGLSRQIGFVRFATVEEATIAMDSMNTVKLDSSAQPLIVKYADTKEQKTARKTLRSQYGLGEQFYGIYGSSAQSPVYYYYPPGGSPSGAYAYSYPIPGYGFQSSPRGTGSDSGSPATAVAVTPGSTPTGSPATPGCYYSSSYSDYCSVPMCPSFAPHTGYEPYMMYGGEPSPFYFYDAQGFPSGEYEGEYGHREYIYDEVAYFDAYRDGEGNGHHDNRDSDHSSPPRMTTATTTNGKNGNGNGTKNGKPASAPINIIH